MSWKNSSLYLHLQASQTHAHIKHILKVFMDNSGRMQGHIYRASWKSATFLSDRLWGIKINPTRWWSHYQIKSQLNSVDMQGGIEGRLFPDSAERCDRSIQGKKGGDISDLSPAESKWINPSYRNHSSWLHPSNAKLHYTGTTATRCVPHPPCPPPPPKLLCLPLLCITPDENIIWLLSMCLSHTNPNPQKWQLSYTGIMLHTLPSTKINYKGLGLASFVASHLRDRLWQKATEGWQRGREWEK